MTVTQVYIAQIFSCFVSFSLFVCISSKLIFSLFPLLVFASALYSYNRLSVASDL